MRRYKTLRGSLAAAVSALWFVTPGTAQTFDFYNGHSYCLSDAAMTPLEAADWAESIGGYLVTVNDEAEQMWLADTYGPLAEGLWIGMRQDCPSEYEPADGWYWVNGEHAAFTYWSSGQPDDGGAGPSQNYALAAFGSWPDGRWDDASLGDAPLRAIAEIPHGVFLPVSAVSFQNEGTSNDDVTSLVSSVDDDWAPRIVGSVEYDYYTTGSDPSWFDAIDIRFDVPFGLDAPMTLMVYVQRGEYVHQDYEHVGAYLGSFNSTDQDIEPWLAESPVDLAHGTNLPPNTTIGWVSIPIPDEWMQFGTTVELTLRLWNIRVDAVRLHAVIDNWPADVNSDGVVDIDDIFAVLANWGPCE